MKYVNKFFTRYSGDQKGVTLVLVTICLSVLLGFAALAVDIGYLMVARNEAQNVADAAALAGALESHYSGKSFIRVKVREAAEKNTIAGTIITTIPNDSIQIGYWNSTRTPPFQASEISEDVAVQVTVKRATGVNGPISTFFAKVLGIDEVSVSARGTAIAYADEEKGVLTAYLVR